MAARVWNACVEDTEWVMDRQRAARTFIAVLAWVQGEDQDLSGVFDM